VNSLHQLMIESAARDRNALAVTGPGGEFRYGELDRQANALAERLAACGVSHGDRVIIWTGKSAAAVVAMQAVLRLGAAYVPASTATPADRMAAMARDCCATAICATAELFALIPDDLLAGAQRVNVTEFLDARHREPERVDYPVAPDDLAYILYTSGSTGTPKGVSISHGNARAFVDWAVAELAATPTDRFASHAPFTFDLSVLDLFAAFAAGAAVCLIPADMAYAPARLVEFLDQQRISVWYSVPSALMLMMQNGGLLDRPAPASLRAVLFAGEPFPIRYVRRLSGWTGARLLNLYGPTETNVCTYHEVGPDDLERDRPVPIGKPCSGDKVWAARPDGSVARVGEEGELIVEGPTVMQGYWGRRPQVGPYATGDIVCTLADGSFDFVGRNDHMVKVRGHRVELGEVEEVLNAHADVAQAVALAVGEGLDARLVAVVARSPGRDPGVLALRRHSAQRLPTYMIPDEIRFVAELPRTVSGKVDHLALAHNATRTVPEEKPS
jgi:amino acid adenylation domain-containing protein